MSGEAKKRFEVIREDMNFSFAEAQASFEKRFERGREEAEKRFEAIREDMNFSFAEAQDNLLKLVYILLPK